MDRVSSNGHLLFLHLLVVLDVVDVQGDFLGRGDRLYLHIHIVVSDGQIAGHGELIALRKGNGAGVDMDRVSSNGHLFFLHLLVVLDVVDVQSDFLGRGDGLHADIHITIRVELSVVDTPCFRCGKRRRRHQSDDQAEHQQNC